MIKRLATIIAIVFTIGIVSNTYANDKANRLAYCLSINTNNNEVVTVFLLSFFAMLEDERIGKYVKITASQSEQQYIIRQSTEIFEKMFNTCLDKPEFKDVTDEELILAFTLWGSNAGGLIFTNPDVKKKYEEYINIMLMGLLNA